MSIKKIAEITGTSPATVSRVLNNPSYKCAVPGLCDKIWRAAMNFFYPEYVIETHQTEKEGFQTMQKFLKLKEPPTGIYCANDITAIGMLKCLNRYSSFYTALRLFPVMILKKDSLSSRCFQPSSFRKKIWRVSHYLSCSTESAADIKK